MSKKTPIGDETTTDGEVKIPIIFETPDSIVTRWASKMVVQLIEDEFKISFFEMKPQIYFGGPLPTEAKAVCVASVVISAQKLPVFVEALQGMVAKYDTAVKSNSTT